MVLDLLRKVAYSPCCFRDSHQQRLRTAVGAVRSPTYSWVHTTSWRKGFPTTGDTLVIFNLSSCVRWCQLHTMRVLPANCVRWCQISWWWKLQNPFLGFCHFECMFCKQAIMMGYKQSLGHFGPFVISRDLASAILKLLVIEKIEWLQCAWQILRSTGSANPPTELKETSAALQISTRE